MINTFGNVSQHKESGRFKVELHSCQILVICTNSLGTTHYDSSQASPAGWDSLVKSSQKGTGEQAQNINPSHLFYMILSLCPHPNSQFMLNALTLSSYVHVHTHIQAHICGLACQAG